MHAIACCISIVLCAYLQVHMQAWTCAGHFVLLFHQPTHMPTSHSACAGTQGGLCHVCSAGHYDKDLFIGIAAHVSAHFTQYETEGLVQLVGAMHAAGQYGTEMLDDM